MLRTDAIPIEGGGIWDPNLGDYKIEITEFPDSPEHSAMDQMVLAMGGNWPEEQFEQLPPDAKAYFCALLSVIACTAIENPGHGFSTMSITQIKDLHDQLSGRETAVAAATLQDLADYAVRLKERLSDGTSGLHGDITTGSEYFTAICAPFDTRQRRDGLPTLFA